MRLTAAAIQMPATPRDVAGNLDRADGLLRRAHEEGVQLAVLPEMFNTGYGLIPDYTPIAEGRDGPTLGHLASRAREWGMAIAAGFVERAGSQLYDSLAFCQPDGRLDVYRKRHLVFWEPSRFGRGQAPLVVETPWGRVGFAVCADMIYKRIWREYRGRIDLAIVAAAWPDFACRNSGRQDWLFGKVGPMAAKIPGKVALDLGIPVIFANQCGETRTKIPVLGTWIDDRFAGKSAICDGRHGAPTIAGVAEELVIAPITIHPSRGLRTCRSTSRWARAGSSSASARS